MKTLSKERGRINLQWVKGMSEEDKKSFIEALTHNQRVNKTLVALIREKKATNTSSTQGLRSYESPNWAYLQADHNGYQRALDEVLELFSFHD